MQHRLSSEMVNILLQTIQEVIPTPDLKAIHLFGSQANVHAKGGDVDVWVECFTLSDNFGTWAKQIRRGLEDRWGDRKTDLVLSPPLEKTSDVGLKAFLDVIDSKKVTLWAAKKF